MVTAQRSPARHRTARSGLSRERIVDAALGEIDERGLDSLTMQGLARTLGAGTMSLYNHVKNKEDLLAAVAGRIWAEIAAGAPAEDDAAAWLETLGRAIRDAGRRHPNVLPVLALGGVAPPPLLAVVAEQFERSGDPEPDPRLVNGISTVSAFAIGWALVEAGGLGPSTGSAQETERQRIRRVTRTLPPETPDPLVDAAIAVCASDAELLFGAGLAAIISGCGFTAPSGSGPSAPDRRHGQRAR